MAPTPDLKARYPRYRVAGSYDAMEFLEASGWTRSGKSRSPGQVHVVTWWRKLGREFPEHLAIWLATVGWHGQF